MSESKWNNLNSNLGLSSRHSSEQETSGERYLCFSLGTEEYGIPLLSVKEVIALPEITPVPQTPAHFLGIMNLRGQIISVMDLRSKLGIKANQSSETAVIICELTPNSIGVVVDSINCVASPLRSETNDGAEIQNQKTAHYVTGVFRNDGKLVLLLDVQKLLGLGDPGRTAQLRTGT
jgi:purine-binding chemotaxis protein CheW